MSQTTDGPAALVTNAVGKTFNGIRVLRDVSLQVRPGQVHALLGHNGSGKSTLIKILAGVYRPDPGGGISVGGRPLVTGSPADAYRAGLRFVHQRITVIDALNAADNLALGEPFRTRFGPVIDWRAQVREAERTLRELDQDNQEDWRRPMGELPAITRSRFAIARALRGLDDHGILVLDEPTASLAPHEIDGLFRSLRAVVERGISLVYVTHRLREVYRIADQITLLRDGRQLASAPVADLPMDELVTMLSDGAGDHSGHSGAAVGAAADAAPPDDAAPSGDAAPSDDGAASPGRPASRLTVSNLSAAGLAGVSLDSSGGEIIGVCGLDGSGREIIARALSGAVPVEIDEITTARGRSDRLDLAVAARLGIVLARESRAPGSVVDEFSIRENISLPMQRRLGRGVLLRPRQETMLARRWIGRLAIRPADSGAKLATMSGGNRQKVVIAKALAAHPDVLVLDDPTAGVDVGAAAALHEIFRAMAGQGRVVVLVSSDIEEICAVADRALVLSDGVIAGDLAGGEITEGAILSLMA